MGLFSKGYPLGDQITSLIETFLGNMILAIRSYYAYSDTFHAVEF